MALVNKPSACFEKLWFLMQYAKNKKAVVSLHARVGERVCVLCAHSLFLWELFPVVDSSSLFRTTLATQQLLVGEGGWREEQQRDYNF